MASEERLNALQTALSQIRKSYGNGSVMLMSESTTMNVSTVSTGSLTLDLALGVGGVPRGRIVEIYGPESAGKSLIAQSIVSQVQINGGIAAYVDVEHALDPTFSQKLGVKVDELVVSQPDTGEEALEITESLIRSGAVDVIVVDSVAALVPRAEIEGDMGDSNIGLQARLMSQALRKITAAISKSNCVCIFINQLREKVGMSFGYGPSETTTGGKALKFYASVRLDIRKIEQIKNGTEVIGHRARVKVVKNKVAPPFKTAEFDIYYDSGISKENEILDIGVEKGVITKSGAWYYYGELRLGQGKENARLKLKEDMELMSEIEQKIKSV